MADLELAFDLSEDLTDLVFDGVGAGGALLESSEIGEQLTIDKGDQIIAGKGGVMIE